MKGKPDIETLDIKARLTNINDIFEVTTKPMIVDGDTGGRAEHFEFDVRSLELKGVSAVVIEDKTGLKKNSLLGTEVYQEQEKISAFCEKIARGKRAQISDEFMVIARVESLVLNMGLDDAIERALAYVDAGADGILIHSRQKNPGEVFEFARRFKSRHAKVPLVCVPTSYAQTRFEELADSGFNIVIYANHMLRAAYPAMREVAVDILRNGRTFESEPKCLSINEIPELIARCSFRTDIDVEDGTVVLAEVINGSGSISAIENSYGRDVKLFAGDRFLGVLGNRRSSTSEYGDFPQSLRLDGTTTLDLLAYGGILGYGRSVPAEKAAKGFLKVRVLGAMLESAAPVTLSQLSCFNDDTAECRAPVLLVCGTAAEVGKTTATGNLIRAFKRRGMRVGAAKLTGTGRLRDILAMQDAGADRCMDFPHVGLASTYTNKTDVALAAERILGILSAAASDVIIAELGGDIIEANIPHLLAEPNFLKSVRSIVHVSGDVLGMMGSIDYYRQLGVDKPIYLTLPKGRNNLATQERLRVFGMTAFDCLVAADCDRIADAVIHHAS